MDPERREREVLGNGDPDGRGRPPPWLSRAVTALAVVLLVAVVGYQLATGEDREDREDAPPAPTPASSPSRAVKLPLPEHPALSVRVALLGLRYGRLAVSLPDGRVRYGPALSGARSSAGRKLYRTEGGNLAYVEDGDLHLVTAVSLEDRTVRPARRIVPAAAGTHVVTPDGAVARVSLPGGQLSDPIPGSGDAIDAGWTPRAVVGDDSVVFVRRSEIAVLRFWDGELQVIAEGALLLGAHHVQVLTSRLDARTRTPVLTTHTVEYWQEEVVSRDVRLPAGWLPVRAPTGFTGRGADGTAFYVRRGDASALAVIGPAGNRALLVQGSRGADSAAGITRGYDSLIFGVTSGAGIRYVSWQPETPATPARLIAQSTPRGFRLAASRGCFSGGCE